MGEINKETAALSLTDELIGWQLDGASDQRVKGLNLPEAARPPGPVSDGEEPAAASGPEPAGRAAQLTSAQRQGEKTAHYKMDT